MENDKCLKSFTNFNMHDPDKQFILEAKNLREQKINLFGSNGKTCSFLNSWSKNEFAIIIAGIIFILFYTLTNL